MFFVEQALVTTALAHTRLLLMPSASDATCHPVYPLWPMQPSTHVDNLDDADEPKRTYVIAANVRERVTCVANPSTFVLGGVVVGGTSADVLFHLSADDATRQPPVPPGAPRPEKVPRMVQHLLEQRSYYPLFPSAADTPLEVPQLPSLSMPVTPDLLLLPSKLKHFVRALGPDDGCLAVNPGLLCRANSAGTYAVIEVAPPRRSDVRTRECETWAVCDTWAGLAAHRRAVNAPVPATMTRTPLPSPPPPPSIPPAPPQRTCPRRWWRRGTSGSRTRGRTRSPACPAARGSRSCACRGAVGRGEGRVCRLKVQHTPCDPAPRCALPHKSTQRHPLLFGQRNRDLRPHRG